MAEDVKKPLAEVEKLATPGPYRHSFHAKLGQHFIYGARTNKEAIAGKTPLNEAAAALLAHWYNHGPRLLEAVQHWLTLDDPSLADFDALEAAATAASEVEV